MESLGKKVGQKCGEGVRVVYRTRQLTLYNLTIKNQKLLGLKNVGLLASDVCGVEHIF